MTNTTPQAAEAARLAEDAMLALALIERRDDHNCRKVGRIIDRLRCWSPAACRAHEECIFGIPTDAASLGEQHDR